jgi:type IV secretory pathway VirB10-like protein
MADAPAASRVDRDPSPAAVTDHRPVPRGVLPRGVQTWVMAGVAIAMLAIMLIVGRPDPPVRPAQATAPVQPPSADRVRDYQDRLRLVEAQAMRDAQAPAPAPGLQPAQNDEPQQQRAEDPIAAERRRREYESLFASNVVLSRRPETERPDIGRGAPPGNPPSRSDGTSPSVDEVADAVVRATTRTAGLATAQASAPVAAAPMAQASTSDRSRTTPDQTPPISAAGPLHRVLEGTVIDTVLTNRLDGSSASPVNCLVTNAVYSYTGRRYSSQPGHESLGKQSLFKRSERRGSPCPSTAS